MKFRDRDSHKPGLARWVLPCANDRDYVKNTPEIGDLVILKEDKTEKLLAFKVEEVSDQVIAGQHRALNSADKNIYPEQVRFHERKICVLIK